MLLEMPEGLKSLPGSQNPGRLAETLTWGRFRAMRPPGLGMKRHLAALTMARSPIRRWSGAGLLLALAVYFLGTLLPWEPLNPFARSKFSVTRRGGLRFDPPSLFHSDFQPWLAELEAVKTGRFSLAFSLLSERFDQGQSSRIVSYSVDEGNPTFMFSQRREHLLVHFGSQVVYLPRLFVPGERHDYVIVLDHGSIAGYVDGALRVREELPGERGPWTPGYLSLANEITGDRPFVGELYELAFIPRPLTAGDVASRRVSRATAGEIALHHDETSQRLWFQGSSGQELRLQRVAWPYRNKWATWPLPYESSRQFLRDSLFNMLATIPIGLLWALWRTRAVASQRWAPPWASAGLLQLACAAVAESSQFFSTGDRFSNWKDVVTNTLGAVLGACLGQLLVRASSADQSLAGPSADGQLSG
jgi:hypothetical protein